MLRHLPFALVSLVTSTHVHLVHGIWTSLTLTPLSHVGQDNYRCPFCQWLNLVGEVQRYRTTQRHRGGHTRCTCEPRTHSQIRRTGGRRTQRLHKQIPKPSAIIGHKRKASVTNDPDEKYQPRTCSALSEVDCVCLATLLS